MYILLSHLGLATDADDSDGSIITGPSTSTPAAKRRRFVHHLNPSDIISCTCYVEECTKLISYSDIQHTQEATAHPCEAELKAHLFQEILNHTRVKRNGQEYTTDHNFVIFRTGHRGPNTQ